MNGKEEKLLVKNISIDKQLNKNVFINHFKDDLMPYDNNDEVFIFSKKHSIYDMEFWIIVGFEKNNIQYIELENADKDLTNSYANWSNYKVKLKKEKHDQWLMQLLGDPDIINDNEIIYNLPWGMVTSYVDPRSGSVCIAIRYSY
ncbi:hypothetical protein [Sporolactobacillus laevolacticus]|uniref:Uncharacterized protein n=1 Tax=Sporolactobacillus laevolacticus DSM 442 TaxID=1395513 RepID=V6IV54_9BACL|nr:hypothetical protein [Sporolactobacillus laevolacticus]EST11007.1 hypothetical protein P343_14400 [Sporolactobacillus laevolacticus DSM 442]